MCPNDGICRQNTECPAQNKSWTDPQIVYSHIRLTNPKHELEVADDSNVQPVVLIAINIIKTDTDLNNLKKNIPILLSQPKSDNITNEKSVRQKRHIADVKSPQDETESKFSDKEKLGKSQGSLTYKRDEIKNSGSLESESEESDTEKPSKDKRDECDHLEYVIFTWIMCLVALATTLKLYYLVKTFLAMIMTTAYALLVLLPFKCVCESQNG